MKNLSVTTFIHILFSVALAILIATFLLFISWDRDRSKIEEFKRYQLISITFLSKLQSYPSNDELDILYDKLHVKPIDKSRLPQLKKDIQEKGKTLFTGGSKAGSVRVFEIDEKHYINVQQMAYNLMFENNVPKNYYFEIAVSSGIFIILILILLYGAVLKKLYPLKKLHRQIEKFANGDATTRITYKHDDEIGKIAKSFDDAIVHINQLSHSKNLFMRNMMHELKTPITKGRIVVEMLDDEATKKILIRAFERMNELITELSEMEKVTTQSFEPNLQYLKLEEIIAESRELLMLQDSCLEININDETLTTDKKLMALVIKNLIDNGTKYGTGECVLVSTNYDIIEVTSEGKALENELSYYTEPFSQAEKRSSGFGLGLYIVHNILQKLGYRLGYKHNDGKNIFMIIPKG